MKITIKSNQETKIFLKANKRHVAQYIKGIKDPFYGVCKISYLSDYNNEFDFSSVEDFNEKSGPCFDKELIEYVLSDR